MFELIMRLVLIFGFCMEFLNAYGYAKSKDHDRVIIACTLMIVIVLDIIWIYCEIFN